jgi:hypothetical protein
LRRGRGPIAGLLPFAVVALLLGLIALVHRSLWKGCSKKLFAKRSTIGGMISFEKGMYDASIACRATRAEGK